jgi:predicted MFS family arabinose efflux permease
MALLGVGTVIGGLVAAHRARPTSRTVVTAAALLGISLLVVATTPSRLAFQVALIPVGALAVFFGTSANGHMQLWSAPELRGRVMAIYMLLTLGTTVAGGPFIGWVCQQWTPRTGLGVAGLATLAAATFLAVPLRARLRDRAPGGGSMPPDAIWEPLDASG